MGFLKSISLVAVLAVAACTQQPQSVEKAVASTLLVQEVTVSTDVTRDRTAVPKEQILEAARSRVYSTLRQANPRGTRPVRVQLNVEQFYIANVGAGLLLGSSTSVINTEITLVDVATNTQIGKPFSVSGVSEGRPTILGISGIGPPQAELALITSDLARNAKIAIYGE